jgi:hypothetical protein
MNRKLKFQIAFLTVSTFFVGVAFGVYLTSLWAKSLVAELGK